MINLLPPEERHQIRAARSNTLLLRYNIFLVGALLFVILALAGVFFYLTNTKTEAAAITSDNNAKVRSYDTTLAQAKRFRDSLSSAKQILDNEVTYSKTILAISRQLPSGVVIDSLNLDATTFGTPTTLSLHARSRETAIAAKDSFANASSHLFSDVHFVNLTVGSDPTYPVNASLSITISKDAAK